MRSFVHARCRIPRCSGVKGVSEAACLSVAARCANVRRPCCEGQVANPIAASSAASPHRPRHPHARRIPRPVHFAARCLVAAPAAPAASARAAPSFPPSVALGPPRRRCHIRVALRYSLVRLAHAAHISRPHDGCVAVSGLECAGAAPVQHSVVDVVCAHCFRAHCICCPGPPQHFLRCGR